MKRYIAVALVLLLPLLFSACGNDTADGENSSIVQNMETSHAEGSVETKSGMESTNKEKTEENKVETNQITIKVGDNALTAVLEDNESAEALKELLADGPLTISASNYGGFEKVCSLGKELPDNDRQMTTHAGDICLYNSNQIVIFYGSNSWAYTKLGKISDAGKSELKKVLGGEETEITLSLD